MVSKKFKTTKATFIENEEEELEEVEPIFEEVEPIFEEEDVVIKAEEFVKVVKDKKEVKESVKEDKFYVVGASIVLNGIKFVKGEEVKVRPIPNFYIVNGHIRKG